MASNTKPTAATLRVAAVVVFLGLMAGAIGLAASCEKEPAKPIASKHANEKIYTTRGRITMLPVPNKPTTQLVIQHEAIDEFVNPDGSRGMNSMEMPMVTSRDVSLAGLAIDDLVEFDLAVSYTPDGRGIEGYQITRIRKLPADTSLKFGHATPTLGDGK